MVLITAGIDAGSKFTKAIILNDNSILSMASKSDCKLKYIFDIIKYR